VDKRIRTIHEPEGRPGGRTWWGKLKRFGRYYGLRLQRLPGNPKRLALSVALGVFIGISPTVPFHFILALSLSTVFRLSRVAAALGTLVSNPLTVAPTYYACFKIGKYVLFQGESLAFPKTLNVMELLKLGWKLNLALQVGGVILALPFTVASYFLTLRFIRRYRLKQKALHSSRGLHLSQDPLPPTGTDS